MDSRQISHIRDGIRNNNALIYDSFLKFRTNRNGRILGSFEIVEFGSLVLKAHELGLPPKTFPGVSFEIVELVYLENREKPFRAVDSRLVDVVNYLNLSHFQSGNYSLVELYELLVHRDDDMSKFFELGYPSTDPRIVEFLSYASRKNSIPSIEKIKGKLLDNFQDVINALQKNVPYKFVEEMLLGNHRFWVFNLYPSLFKNEKIGKLLLDLSSQCIVSIPAELARQFSIVNQQILLKLAYLPKRRIAMGKLLLMMYFPEDAQYIYDSDLLPALKFILMRKLSPWRREIAEQMNWEDVGLVEGIPFLNGEFKLAKNYYDGYKENRIFDDFIRIMVSRMYWGEFKLTFRRKEGPDSFLKNYKKMIVMNEYQGTIYSIIQDDCGFLWGPVDPKGTKVIVDFENEIINKHSSESGKDHPYFLWLRAKLVEIMGVAYSRLAFDLDYYMPDFIRDHFERDSTGLNAAAAVGEMFLAVAHFCQPQKSLGWRASAPKQSYEFVETGGAIWNKNIEDSDLLEGYQTIWKCLEEGPALFVRKFLLALLEGIFKKHFSAEEVRDIDFTVFSPELKESLEALIDTVRLKQSLYALDAGDEDSKGPSGTEPLDHVKDQYNLNTPSVDNEDHETFWVRVARMWLSEWI